LKGTARLGVPTQK